MFFPLFSLFWILVLYIGSQAVIDKKVTTIDANTIVTENGDGVQRNNGRQMETVSEAETEQIPSAQVTSMAESSRKALCLVLVMEGQLDGRGLAFGQGKTNPRVITRLPSRLPLHGT